MAMATATVMAIIKRKREKGNSIIYSVLKMGIFALLMSPFFLFVTDASLCGVGITCL